MFIENAIVDADTLLNENPHSIAEEAEIAMAYSWMSFTFLFRNCIK